MPVFLVRGGVFRIRFYLPADPQNHIIKYCVCLQEGRIVEGANAFVGILLTTKHLDNIYKTDVFVSPAECNALNGAKVLCNQIYTIPKDHIIDFAYSLSEATMKEIDQKLLLGIGIVRLEDFD